MHFLAQFARGGILPARWSAGRGALSGTVVCGGSWLPGGNVRSCLRGRHGVAYILFGGQELAAGDRLAFFGEGQNISVHLSDCRNDVGRPGAEITIGLAVSPYRVLTIPKGVAHTLDGLGGVVTRDEPVW
ncbi:hypothetical protein [Streptomyces sp. CS090A]|uniref:hypothetical protein n=1 Tax=Streptomyces sp. CS090A TaxID=2162710 RepID=UPI001EF53099|nr:hypothetical protein [Streptomyces sp. CS090A]